jgi:hypothetical protein
MDSQEKRFRVAPFVPVELQRRGFHNRQIMWDPAARAFEPVPGGFKQVQPWCRWQGLSQYLDCVAFADRTAKEMPTGRALTVEHATPGRFYSVGIVFFTQALIDNVAVWLCEAMSLKVAGGDRHFRSAPFKRELRAQQPVAREELAKHGAFVEYINKYRQVWIHTISGGAIPTSDVSPFESPQSARKFLGVPLDPDIQPDRDNYMERVEQCAGQNNGQYLHKIEDFTGQVFEQATAFYLGWLGFALDYIG